jgi:predicted GNAT superfamily acetyltransferase
MVRIAGDPIVLRRGDGEGPDRAAGEVGDAAILEIPVDHASMRVTAPDVAQAWRDAVAEVAAGCLASGLVGVSFDRERSAYVFARPVEP